MEGMEKYHCGDHVTQPTWLPPGFRFHPTDEELITYYLARKMADGKFRDEAITEVDLNRHEPWDLPGKAQMVGEKEWYFYALKDRKYPSGSRTNRATKSGYWKATGKDKEVFMQSSASNGSCKQRQLVGMKKTLVFYVGRAPKGSKTNWVMHEYRMYEHANTASMLDNIGFTKVKGTKDPWVLCRVFHKKLRHGESEKDRYQQEAGDTKMLGAAANFLLADDEWDGGGAATTHTNKLVSLPLDVVASLLNMAGADKSCATTASMACNTTQLGYNNDSNGGATKSEPALPRLLEEQYSSKNVKDYSRMVYSGTDCTASSKGHGQYRNGVSSGGEVGNYATLSNSINDCASSDAWLPANSSAYTSTPVPSFPSELESLWLHTPPFCV